MSITNTVNGTTGTTLPPATTTGSGTLGSSTGSSSSSSASSTGAILNQNSFLQLMMTQLQDQDPLSPDSSDPTQYLNELAQMTDVEQEANIAQSDSQMATTQNDGNALSLLGHTVTWTDGNGNFYSGLVQKVDFTSNGPSLTISGQTGIAPSAVTEVT